MSDMITRLRARRQAALDDMQAILNAVGDGDLTAEQTARFDALDAQAKKLDADIERAVSLEAMQAAAAKPVPPLAVLPVASAAAPVPTAGVPAQPKEKGLKFGAAVRILAAAGGEFYRAEKIAEAEGHSGLFANQNMGSGAAGGFLVPEEVSSEVIELLRPQSVIMGLGPMIVPMAFGNFTMNRLANGAQAQYIGEQQAIPATRVDFGQVRLSSKKLAGLIPISNDLIRSTGSAADRIVRDDISRALAQRMDGAFIRGAGTQFTPRGLRFQHEAFTTAATHVLPANATVNLANVTADLGRAELALLQADVPAGNQAWLMAPRSAMYLRNVRDGNGNFAFPEMQNGQLRGKPVAITTQIPVNLGGGANESEIILADFAHVVVGEQAGIEIGVSSEAAYVDANATMQAAFSRDETVIRAIAQHDIGVRHLPSVAILTAVLWTP